MSKKIMKSSSCRWVKPKRTNSVTPEWFPPDMLPILAQRIWRETQRRGEIISPACRTTQCLRLKQYLVFPGWKDMLIWRKNNSHPQWAEWWSKSSSQQVTIWKKNKNLKAGACALASTLKIIDLGKDLANDLFSRTTQILSNGYGNMIYFPLGGSFLFMEK